MSQELTAAEAARVEAEEARAAVDDPEDAWRAAEAAKETVKETRAASMQARGAADDLRRAASAREARLAEASQERAGWRARQQNAAHRITELETRLAETREEKQRAADAPGEIAARRDELNAQLADLRAPVIAAEEAFERADGLIGEIDRLVRERQTERLLERGPSPLAPNNWRRAGSVSAIRRMKVPPAFRVIK